MFTIIDASKVQSHDLSSNFFLSEDDLGAGIAESAVRNLNELNVDSMGQAIEKDVETLVDDPSFWSQFSLVIATSLYGDVLSRLAGILFHNNIPLLQLGSVGFYGFLRIINQEHTILDSHTAPFIDMRLNHPWTELRNYVDSIDLAQLDHMGHAHVPYIVILIKALDAWKAEGRAAPATSSEKKEFKSFVAKRYTEHRHDLNIQEALKNSFRVAQCEAVPKNLECTMSNPAAEENGAFFWICISALKQYVKEEGTLPLPGSLPDMASDTASYVKLQTVYREKALRDTSVFVTYVNDVLLKRGNSLQKVEIKDLANFCKNSRSVAVLLQQGYDVKDEIYKNMDQMEDSSLLFGFLAVNTFYSQFQKLPDSLTTLLDFTVKLFSSKDKHKSLPPALIDILSEFVRSEGVELHNISSFMGGLAAQECLKLITHQYIPLDNTLVFDGIKSTTTRWKI